MTQATAMLLTLVIEVPVVLALAAARGWARGERGTLALVAVGANLLTHPLLWFADDLLSGSLEYAPRLAVLEVLVTLAEGFVYAVPAGLGARRGVVTSLVANATSTAAGLAIYAFS